MAGARRTRGGRYTRRAARREPIAGDLVIDGFVRARLLGFSLLTLDARVVVGPIDRAPVPGSDGPDGRPAVRWTGQRADLSRAVQLLGDGSRTLDRVRSNG